MIQLVLLFFAAHPGSAATFGDTRSFLMNRYPNRDIVPSSLIKSRDDGDWSGMAFAAMPIVPSSSPAVRALKGCSAKPFEWRRNAVIGDFISALDTNEDAAAVKPAAATEGPDVGQSISSIFKKSTTSVIDVYDTVVSFVECKMVTTDFVKSWTQNWKPDVSVDTTFLKDLGAWGGQMSAATGGSHQLVGFMDVDPFERSRRYFKRKPRITM